MLGNNLDLSSVTGRVVIIPAAGIGKRFGEKTPKQYQKIEEQMVLDITLDIFLSSTKINKVILVISPNDCLFKTLNALTHDKLIVIEGGEERDVSVNNALRYCFDNGLADSTPLLVHDAVRPCLSERDLNRLIEYFDQHGQACLLVEKISDSVKKISQGSTVLSSVNRDDLVLALTPQMATFIELKNAFSTALKEKIKLTDEVGALTNNGIQVDAVIAHDINLKITQKRDLELTKIILASRKV